MPPERTNRPRQEPASCYSCRKKKLKCDRSPRCSNCQARSVECNYQGRTQQPTPPSVTGDADLLTENATIKARLRKLELAVFGGGHLPLTTEGLAVTGRVASITAATVGKGLRSPVANSNTPEYEHVRDSRWLESVGTYNYTELPRLSGSPCIRVEPLREILQSTKGGNAPKQVLLPCLAETIKLFQCYVEHLDALQHIIHVRTVDTMIMQLYRALEDGEPSKHSHLALVLSILASIGGYWGLRDKQETLFSSSVEAASIGRYWLRATLDVLERVWRTESPDVETVQTTIIVVFLIYHVDGFSPNLRHLHSTAIANAKNIGLHLTDSPHNKRTEETQEQIIDAEVRRRVWWHLASTDWSLSLIGGPYEGTYSVHPRHMQVKKPRNITDEDLTTRDATFSRPLTEATATSYYLLRIRLAEVCREAADIAWDMYATGDPEQIAYDRILTIDARFAELLKDMPDTLHVYQQDIQHQLLPDTARSQLIKQYYFSALTTHARRTKLHLPFLLRAERDHRYTHSREVCLESARNVLALRNILPDENSNMSPSMRLSGVLHHFFCALVVLVMDICVNKRSGDLEERKTEVQHACKIFEDAKERSAPARTFLDSLMAILRKHKVRLRQCPAYGFENVGNNMEDDLDHNVANCQSAAPNSEQQAGDVGDMNFADDLWETYFDMGANLEPQQWDTLFSDLDMQVGQ